MKIFLSYFIKFNKNILILSKKYFKNSIINKFNRKLNIIIIYNKKLFSINNKYQNI